MELGAGAVAAGTAPAPCAPVLDALEQFRLGLEHLVKIVEDGGLADLDDAGLIGFMRDFEQIRNQIPMADHRVIADAERRGLPETVTQPNLTRMLTAVLRLSPAEASRRVRAAAAVGDRVSMLGEPLAPQRPELAAAQRAGAVSPEQVAIIERALERVDHRGFDPADLADGERLLTGFAERFGPKELRLLAKQVVDHIDPDGSRPADDLNAERRHLQIRPTTDGAWTGEFRLTGALGSKLMALLGPLAKPRNTQTTADASPEASAEVSTGASADGSADAPAVGGADVRSSGQRMHDALEDVCDRLLRADAAVPDAGGTPATLLLTLDIEDLLAKTGYAVTSDGTLIRTEQALALADQADIYFAAVTAAGVVTRLGRRRRIASPGQTVALIARDKGCSFPGCDVPPQWCERHNIRPWLDGGQTNLDNLTLLCRYHHHQFLARGWTCRMNTDGLPEWRPPPALDPHQHPLISTKITGGAAARRHRRMRT